SVALSKPSGWPRSAVRTRFRSLSNAIFKSPLPDPQRVSKAGTPRRTNAQRGGVSAAFKAMSVPAVYLWCPRGTPARRPWCESSTSRTIQLDIDAELNPLDRGPCVRLCSRSRTAILRRHQPRGRSLVGSISEEGRDCCAIGDGEVV